MGLPKAGVGNRADVPKWEPVDRNWDGLRPCASSTAPGKVLPGRLPDHSVSQ